MTEHDRLRIVVLLGAPKVSPNSAEVLEGLSPCDLHAVQTALSLAGGDGSMVTALTAGPAIDESPLRRALALGVGRAVRLWRDDISYEDLFQIGSLIGAALSGIGFDLILAGDRSPNWSSGATGPVVAHVLNIPHVAGVTAVELSDGKFKLRRGHERGVTVGGAAGGLLLTIAGGPSQALVDVGDEIATIEAIDCNDPQDDDIGTGLQSRPTLACQDALPSVEPTLPSQAEIVADAPALFERLQTLLGK